MFRSVGPMLIVGLIAAFPCARDAAAQSVMSGQEIRAKVIGNTITGVEDDEFYAEYLSPDGRVLGRTESGPYSGSWRIEGDELCVLYVGLDQGKSDWDCTALMLNGNQLVWVDREDGDVVTTLSEGDAEYLKADALLSKPAREPSFPQLGMRPQTPDPAAIGGEPQHDAGSSSTGVAVREGAPAPASAGRPAAQEDGPADGTPGPLSESRGGGGNVEQPPVIDGASPAAGEARSPGPGAAIPADERLGDDAAMVPAATALATAMREGFGAAMGAAVAPQRVERSAIAAPVAAPKHVRKAPTTARAARTNLAATSVKSRRIRVVNRVSSMNDDVAAADQELPVFGPESRLVGEGGAAAVRLRIDLDRVARRAEGRDRRAPHRLRHAHRSLLAAHAAASRGGYRARARAAHHWQITAHKLRFARTRAGGPPGRSKATGKDQSILRKRGSRFVRLSGG